MEVYLTQDRPTAGLIDAENAVFRLQNRSNVRQQLGVFIRIRLEVSEECLIFLHQDFCGTKRLVKKTFGEKCELCMIVVLVSSATKVIDRKTLR